MTKVYIADVTCLGDSALYQKAYASVSPDRQAKADALAQQEDKFRSVGAGLLLGLAAEAAYTNLSHSGNYAICVASDHSVGCDIEQINPSVNLKLARRFFTEGEADFVSASDNSVETFFRLWTLKESFMKCLGQGFARPLNSFEIGFEDGKAKSLMEADGTPYFFLESDLVTGYRVSICQGNLEDAVEYETINLKNLF